MAEQLPGTDGLLGHVVRLNVAVDRVLNEIVEKPPAGYEYDAIIELWFASVADAVSALSDPAVQAAMSGQPADVHDPARSVQMFTRITHTWTAPKS